MWVIYKGRKKDPKKALKYGPNSYLNGAYTFKPGVPAEVSDRDGIAILEKNPIGFKRANAQQIPAEALFDGFECDYCGKTYKKNGGETHYNKHMNDHAEKGEIPSWPLKDGDVIIPVLSGDGEE